MIRLLLSAVWSTPVSARVTGSRYLPIYPTLKCSTRRKILQVLGDNVILTLMLHNLEAEQAVIAAVLLDNDCLETFTRLQPSHFYSPAHKTIYEAICYLTTKNTPVDLVTLSERLKAIGKLDAVGGNDYLTSIMDVIPSAVNFKHYVAILKKNQTLRRLATAATTITQSLENAEDEHDALQKAEKLIFDISREDEKKELTKLAVELPTVLDNYDLVARDPSALKGIKTGFDTLDSITNGLQKGNLIIIGARPSVGKTSFALNIVLNAALKGKTKVAVFSLEMSKRELANRALCSVAKVSLTRATRGKLTPEEWSRLWEANAKLQNANIYVDDTGSITPEEIMRKCMRLQREHGLDLVMIDYLGLMGSKSTNRNESRQDQVATNSRMMKNMAKELDIPVILLSQLNRGIEARKGADSEPMLSDLRESGAIEQDADIVMFIHKPKTETVSEQNEHSRDYEAKIIVAKNRNGPTPYFKLQFIGELTTFMDIDKVGKETATAPVSAVGNVPAPEVLPIQDSSISDIF